MGKVYGSSFMHGYFTVHSGYFAKHRHGLWLMTMKHGYFSKGDESRYVGDTLGIHLEVEF